MRKIRVGVVGVGNLGQHHARVYAELPECELVGVADVDPKALQRITRQFKVSGYTDYRELFGKVDACSIVVPTVLHHALARDFLEHGVHVLVEKPITTTEEEARDLIGLLAGQAAFSKLGTSSGSTPAIMRLRQIVRDPAFIEGHRLGPSDPRVKISGSYWTS